MGVLCSHGLIDVFCVFLFFRKRILEVKEFCFCFRSKLSFSS